MTEAQRHKDESNRFRGSQESRFQGVSAMRKRHRGTEEWGEKVCSLQPSVGRKEKGKGGEAQSKKLEVTREEVTCSF